MTAAWIGWMGPVVGQATLLLAAVLLLDVLVLRRAWPQLRVAVWTVALLKLVLPPGLSSPVSVASLVHGTGAPAPAPAAEAATTSWDAALLVLWVVGAVAVALLAARRARRARRRLLDPAGRRGIPDVVMAAAERARMRLGLGSMPPLVATTAIRTAAVLGTLRPIVLLPADLHDRLSPRRIEHVLLHEFAHVRRRDPWSAAAVACLQVVYWFHPLVWIAGRRLAALREMCCDATVARALEGGAGAYRHTLLVTARDVLLEPERPSWRTAPFVGGGSLLLARLRWLESGAWRQVARTRLVTLLAVATLAACVVPMAPHLEEVAGLSAGDLLARARQVVDDKQSGRGGPGCIEARYAALYLMANDPEMQSRGK